MRSKRSADSILGEPIAAWSCLDRHRKASPSQAGRIMKTAMQMEFPKGLNRLADNLLEQVIEAYDDHRY